MRWKHIALGLFCWSCVLAIKGAAQDAPQQSDVIRINTALVTLNVNVTDRQGRALERLQQSNFAVYEDGQLQTLDFFGAEDQPISFGLLIDRSKSMGENGKLENAKAVLYSFLRAGNPQNEAFCLAFNESSGLVTDFTTDYAGLAATLGRLWAEGGTALYDGINAGLDNLQRGKHRRRALIVVTDGLDEHSQTKLAELLKRIQQSNVQLYLIGFFSPYEAALYQAERAKIELNNGQWVDNPRYAFQSLAAETGAESFFPRSNAEFEKTVAEIAAKLRRQYTLAYYPNNQAPDGRYRKIEVRLKDVPGGHVKTRQGYRLSEPLDPATPMPMGETPAEPAISPRAVAPTSVLSGRVESAPPSVFREMFDQPNGFWPQTDKAFVGQGKYHVRGETVIPVPLFYRDFELTVTTALGRGPLPQGIDAMALPTLGLSFRINPAGYYEVTWAAIPNRHGGRLTLSKVVGGRRTVLQHVDSEPVIGVSNQIKLHCLGPQVELFINGLLVANVKDGAHSAGTFNLLFNGSEATFDDLVIKRIK